MKCKLLIILTIVCSCKPGTPEDSGLRIIGGEITEDVLFAPFISIQTCSAVVIGANTIATAAHCVQNFSGPQSGTLNSKYESGQSLTISNGASQGLNSQSVVIEKTVIHPSWEQTCTKASPCDPKRAAAAKNPGVFDIALILLRTPVKNITPALVDFTPLRVSESVVLAGYGCEGGINTGPSQRRKIKKTAVGDGQVLLGHQGSERLNVIPQTLSANFITPGGQSNGSLCPGDSGGPVLKVESNRLHWVGVNADYTFTGEYEQAGSIPQTNIHTRIDAPDVKNWIQSIAKDISEPGAGNAAITIAIGVTQENSLEKVNLIASTVEPSEKMVYCFGDCTIPASDSIVLDKKSERQGRSFFTTDKPVDLKLGDATVFALDANEKVLRKSKKTIQK